MTVPQIGAMYRGDQSRKQTLIDYGFRLPSAADNRPLKFTEFQTKLDQVLYVSATPAEFELEESGHKWAEQVIRPTGLLDPIVEIHPASTQVDHLFGEIKKEIKKNNRVLITTLTKKSAEDLTKYYIEQGLKVKYLHSDIDTLERIEIINELRNGEFDVLVGINLLREGIDLPEVTLVGILDADKEGFLRSERALVQTIGRAARNSEGRVILYANQQTKSIKAAIKETNRRRQIQEEHNLKHNITPTTVKKGVKLGVVETLRGVKEKEKTSKIKKPLELNQEQLEKRIKELEAIMKKLVKQLKFEEAAKTRDEIKMLKEAWMFSGKE